MKKSDTITLSEISGEIASLWGFIPYEIHTRAPSIERFSTVFEVECKNCNHHIVGTFGSLEDFRKKGYYCPECMGSHNPIYEDRLPKDFKEINPKYDGVLDAEYSIMTRIEEEYGYRPYRFKSIDKGNSVQLEHVCCSTIFSATPTMLFENRDRTDFYTGEQIKLPYCPKCNKIFENDHISYGGARFIEKLDTYFRINGAEFPYEFGSDDIYRFKSYDAKLVVTCKFCRKRFTETPNNLFTTDFRSKCPICDGKPVPVDSADKQIHEVETEIKNDILTKVEAPSQQTNEIVEDIFDDIPEAPVETEQETINVEVETVAEPVTEEIELSIEVQSEEFDDYSNEPPIVESSELIVDESSEIKGTIEETIDAPLIDTTTNLNGRHYPAEVIEESFSESRIIEETSSIEEESYDPEVEDPIVPEPVPATKLSEVTLESLNIDEFETNEQVEEDSFGNFITDDEQTYSEEDQIVSAEDVSQIDTVDSVVDPEMLADYNGYPTEYTPVSVEIPVPDFANPPQVTDEFDQMEDNGLVSTDIEPAEEPFDEFVESMHEIMEDMGVDLIDDGTILSDSSEELDDEAYSEYDEESAEYAEETNSSNQPEFCEQEMDVQTNHFETNQEEFSTNEYPVTEESYETEVVDSALTMDEVYQGLISEEPVSQFELPQEIAYENNEIENQVDIINVDDPENQTMEDTDFFDLPFQGRI